MKTKLLFILILIFSGLYALVVNLMPSPPEKQAFINGNILTMDINNSIVEAIAVERDRIVAVGDNEQIKKYTSDWRGFETTDLAGKTMMPGFIDAHGHFPGSGLTAIFVDLNSPPIGTVSTVAQALELLKARAAITPKGEWLVGIGYDDTLLKEGRHFTREELDGVSTDHPIYLMHTSLHMGVANSLALAERGIDSQTPDPDDGQIGRQSNSREPNGFVSESMHKIFAERLFKFGPVDNLKIISTAVDEYLSEGVTTVQSGLVVEELMIPLALGSVSNVNPMRMVVFPEEILAAKMVDKEKDYSVWESDKFIIGPVKLVGDGSIQGYTGYLTEPYFKSTDGAQTEERGFPNYDQQKLNKLVDFFHDNNMQMAIHGNGDASIDMIIEAFDLAQSKYKHADPRLILIHSQMARQDQLHEMKRLGITPSFFSAHVFYWGDRHRNQFIGKRAETISPANSAIQLDLRFSHHLDTPVVPMSPLFSVWVTVNRQTRSGYVLGENEKIAVMQSLRALTIDAAYQIFKENDLGSIEVGKLADLVVLDENPLSTEKALKDIKVESTIIGGVLAYTLSNTSVSTASVSTAPAATTKR